MNHRAIERVGQSGRHYMFFYTPDYRAFVRVDTGWEPVEMKASAKDCGIESKSGNANTHWYGAQLFDH